MKILGVIPGVKEWKLDTMSDIEKTEGTIYL